MKNLFFILLLCLSRVFGQAPDIEWQNTIGGSGYDYFTELMITDDNGVILAGYSQSGISGDKTEDPIGLSTSDYWIVKLDSNGIIEWENTIGGSQEDFAETISKTEDGGYILGGWSNSNISGDKNEDALIYLYYDYWVIKLDSIGEIEWQNTIGGNAYDYLQSIKQTTDGGYILGGKSASSISGNKSENAIGAGTTDYWVIKLAPSGIIQWQNTIGGNEFDDLQSISQTSDGGFILGGFSNSGISGDKTESNQGANDFWVVKIDALGNIQWQNSIGGTGEDKLYEIKQTIENGYILAGYSASDISPDKSESPIGYEDYWIIKLDSVGNIEWENTIGGSNSDRASSIQQTIEGGYILTGWSASGVSGDKSDSTRGANDYWIIKLDAFGNILWDTTLGGTSSDYSITINQTSDVGYIIGGFSESNKTGDKTEENLGATGSTDYWIIKLEPDCFSMFETCNDLDDNCNGFIDEGLLLNTLYMDSDGDSYGNSLVDTATCFIEILGWVSDSSDCDDSNPLIYPGAPEILDGIDNNCNKIIDEGFNSVENVNNSEFSIYPNPSTDKIILTINNQFNLNSSSNISIFDLSGKIISQLLINSDETEIDVSEFGAGIYFVKVIVGGNQFAQKIIIE